MASTFTGENIAAVTDARSNVVEKVLEPKRLQTLPQGGQALPQERQAQKPTEEQASQAAEIMNNYAQKFHRQLQFSVDDLSDRIVITVIDRDTDEVIRQIPSEEALNFARKLVENDELDIFDKFV